MAPTVTKRYLAKATFGMSYYSDFESAKDLWLWNISSSGGRMSRVFWILNDASGGRNTFPKQMYGISLFSCSFLRSCRCAALLDPRPSFFCFFRSLLPLSSFAMHCSLSFLATIPGRPPVNPLCAQRRLQLQSSDRGALIQAEYNAVDCCPLLILTLGNPPGLCCSYWISSNISNLWFQLCYEILSWELWNVSHKCTCDAMVTGSLLWHRYQN